MKADGDNVADKLTLTEEERVEIQAREQLIGTHQRTAQLLQSELRLFLNHLLSSKGLDPAKQYTIAEDGALTEVESEEPDG